MQQRFAVAVFLVFSLVVVSSAQNKSVSWEEGNRTLAAEDEAKQKELDDSLLTEDDIMMNLLKAWRPHPW
jgi:hypothetical protein